ncbi:MAG: hypothetical protein IKW85_02695 [Muribaculaceae bacterium]|nr:hypothetical protein [Muribaculaceae bacterium]
MKEIVGYEDYCYICGAKYEIRLQNLKTKTKIQDSDDKKLSYSDAINVLCNNSCSNAR